MLEVLRQLLRQGAHRDAPPEVSQLSLACLTNTGLTRAHNEDNFLFCGQLMPREHQSLDAPLVAQAAPDETVCAAVLDGMGGELAGEAASHAAAIALRDAMPSLALNESSVLAAFRAMQDAVRAVRDSRRLSSVGTTATLLLARGAEALVANLGDSPAFLLHDGELATLSVAHTDAELLRMLGVDRKSGLTQFLGMDETDAPIEPHIATLRLQPHDRILLASDGLTDMVGEADIVRALREVQDLRQLVSDLCAQALAAGGADNITLIACEAASRSNEARRKDRQ